MIEEGEVVLLKDRLDGSGHVGVDGREFALGITGWPKGVDHLVRINATYRGRAIVPRHVDALRMMCEIIEIETDLIASGADNIAYFINEPGLAVRGQAHHFVFVAVLGKAEVLGERGVEDPKRVRKMN